MKSPVFIRELQPLLHIKNSQLMHHVRPSTGSQGFLGGSRAYSGLVVVVVSYMFRDLSTPVLVNGIEQLLHFLRTESLRLSPRHGFIHEVPPAVIIHLTGDDILTGTG